MKKRFFVTLFAVFMLLATAIIPLNTAGQAQDDVLLKNVGLYGNNRIEKIDYTRKDDYMMTFNGGFPDYQSAPGGQNQCAPVAAAMTLGYYAQWFPNLIPGHPPVFYVGNLFFISGQTAAVNDVINELAWRMGGTQNGVSIPNLKAGLTSFVNNKGMRTVYVSSMSGSNFSYSAFKNEINAKRPVVLPLTTYHLAQIGTGSQQDTVAYTYPLVPGAHAMVGYGYREIKYYRMEMQYILGFIPIGMAEVNFRTDTFLMVSSGHGMQGYLNINHSFSAYEAFGVWIGW